MGKKNAEKAVEWISVIMMAITMARIPMVHHHCLVNGKVFSTVAKSIYICAFCCGIRMVMCMAIVKEKITLSKYEGIFLTMICCQVIGCFNAIDKSTAVFGKLGRNEGLLMLLCYYLFFYIARMVSSEKMRNITIGIFLSVMTLHSLYGLGQFYDLTELTFIHDYYHYAVSGVAGNPNFMASLMVMASGVAMGFVIYAKTLYGKLASGILMVMFVATLIFTKTMSGYVGFAVSVIAAFTLFIRFVQKKRGTKVALVTVLMSTIAGVVVLIVVDRLAYGIILIELKGLYYQIVYGFDINTVASGRLLIWKNIFEMLPQYIFSGVGIDCLMEPYYRRYGLLFGSYVDKAHNELLQVLITMGLPVFLCYLAVYHSVIKDLVARIKTGVNRPVNMALMLAFIGYVSQGMFNISIIDVAPYFWMLLGLSAQPLVRTDYNENSTPKLKNRGKSK